MQNHVEAANGPRKPQLLSFQLDDLREAIEQRAIEAHYQPLIDIRSGAVRAMEALARWEHPTRGLIPPDEFIPVAESEGLIHELTLLVLSDALLQATAWRAIGAEISVAVNLSPLLLHDSSLVRELAALQRCHDIPPHRIVFEITESSLFREVPVALENLMRLRLRGFGLALDDYGAGFSSLRQLARIPFTELKIDRSLVAGAHRSERLQVVLGSTMEMARRLGVATTAEGVESMEEYRLLRQYGCDAAQGWLLGRPMPGDVALEWLRDRQNPATNLESAL